ncbi:aromatic amino acid DMT transporter YddG [Erwinia amylovora]
MVLTPQRATLTGLCAIVLWSTTVGLIRSISESLGPTGGAAWIYSASALFLCLARGWPSWRTLPARYLWLGGLLFVSYEICLAVSIGLAHNRPQALELGMINYLWPSLTIVFAIPLNRQHFRWWLWPGLILALGGIVWVLKGDSAWTPLLLCHNIMDNPLAYGLAFFAAFAWAMYNNVTLRYAEGQSGVTLFFVITALALWAKFFITGQPQPMQFSTGVVLEALFMAASTAIAYSAWNTGIQHGNMTLLATASYFTPVFSALLASLWLQLTPSFGFWQGVAMVTAGSLIGWRATR